MGTVTTGKGGSSSSSSSGKVTGPRGTIVSSGGQQYYIRPSTGEALKVNVSGAPGQVSYVAPKSGGRTSDIISTLPPSVQANYQAATAKKAEPAQATTSQEFQKSLFAKQGKNYTITDLGATFTLEKGGTKEIYTKSTVTQLYSGPSSAKVSSQIISSGTYKKSPKKEMGLYASDVKPSYGKQTMQINTSAQRYVELTTPKPPYVSPEARYLSNRMQTAPFHQTISKGIYGETKKFKLGPDIPTRIATGFVKFPKQVITGTWAIGQSIGFSIVTGYNYLKEASNDPFYRTSKEYKRNVGDQFASEWIKTAGREDVQVAATIGAFSLLPASLATVAGRGAIAYETASFVTMPSYEKAGSLGFLYGISFASPFVEKSINEAFMRYDYYKFVQTKGEPFILKGLKNNIILPKNYEEASLKGIFKKPSTSKQVNIFEKKPFKYEEFNIPKLRGSKPIEFQTILRKKPMETFSTPGMGKTESGLSINLFSRRKSETQLMFNFATPEGHPLKAAELRELAIQRVKGDKNLATLNFLQKRGSMFLAPELQLEPPRTRLKPPKSPGKQFEYKSPEYKGGQVGFAPLAFINPSSSEKKGKQALFSLGMFRLSKSNAGSNIFTPIQKPSYRLNLSGTSRLNLRSQMPILASIQKQWQPQKQRQQQKSAQDQIRTPIMDQIIITTPKYPNPTVPPPPPPPPPPVKFPSFKWSSTKKSKRSKAKPIFALPRYRYTASIVPAQFKKFGKMPKILTGVSPRYLTRRI